MCRLWSIHSGRTTSRYRSSGASITPLERQLSHEANRLGLAADAERCHPGGFPFGEALADALTRAAERDLVDERIGHGGFGFGLAARQVEILDLRRGVVVAVAAHDFVVEVAAAGAHAAHVEGDRRLVGGQTGLHVV